MKARGADAPSLERIPRVAAGARPHVILAGRPAAERATDAWAGGVEAFLVLKLAINNDGRLVVREGAHAQ
jgi:hypothetical protein